VASYLHKVSNIIAPSSFWFKPKWWKNRGAFDISSEPWVDYSMLVQNPLLHNDGAPGLMAIRLRRPATFEGQEGVRRTLRS
jgi:hypothetical protein